jgi:hypothetical protein
MSVGTIFLPKRGLVDEYFPSTAISILTPHSGSLTIQPLFPSQSLTTQRKDITMKNTKNIPGAVSALLGKKLNKIHILKFNEKKSKPGKPVVDCKCLACGKLSDSEIVRVCSGVCLFILNG